VPKPLRTTVLVLCVLARPSFSPAAESPTPTAPVAVRTVWSGDEPPIGFTGGAASLDALIDQFLAAVKAGDLEALHRLRVSAAEYGSIIVPGEVPKGQPPRQTFAKVNDVFYGMLDSRSRYAAQNIVDRFKGRDFVRHELALSKGTREWAWYTGRGEVRLTLVDAGGEKELLKTGWTAEVGGRFKFIGFNWDN
jgi:hypothetical protein